MPDLRLEAPEVAGEQRRQHDREEPLAGEGAGRDLAAGEAELGELLQVDRLHRLAVTQDDLVGAHRHDLRIHAVAGLVAGDVRGIDVDPLVRCDEGDHQVAGQLAVCLGQVGGHVRAGRELDRLELTLADR